MSLRFKYLKILLEGGDNSGYHSDYLHIFKCSHDKKEHFLLIKTGKRASRIYYTKESNKRKY